MKYDVPYNSVFKAHNFKIQSDVKGKNSEKSNIHKLINNSYFFGSKFS